MSTDTGLEKPKTPARQMSNPLPENDRAAAQEIKRRAAAIVPALREAGPEVERTGTLPPHVVEAMYEAGVYTLGVPKEFGGHPDISVRDVSEILLQIGRGSGAAAWSVAINIGGHFVMGFDDRVIEEVFRTKHIGPLTSGSLVNISNSEGFGRKVPGGFMVRGAWAFSSNVRIAAWHLGGFDWDDNGTSRRRFVILPRKDFKIGDDWHVWGLRGTGSNSAYVSEEVFVPDYRTVAAEEFLGNARRKGRVRAPDPAGNGCMCIGMAYSALEAFMEKAKKRAPLAQAYKTMADMQSTQILVANAMTTIKSCEATMLYWADRADRRRQDLGSPESEPSLGTSDVEEQYASSHACADVIRRVRGVVGDLTIAIGSSALLETDAIGRNLRDITAVGMHVWHRPNLLAENYGRSLLGLEVGQLFASGNVATQARATEPRKLPILED